MSAKLEAALSKKQVLIRKIVSGEVRIFFLNREIKEISVSHNGVIDLLSRRGVTVDAIRSSNLKELIAGRIIEIV